MNSENWFSPDRMEFFSIKVRGQTEWIFFELSEQGHLVGTAEVTGGYMPRSAVHLAARFANYLRGEKIRTDGDVMRLIGVSDEDCSADHELATAVSGLRCAVSDALAKRAELPLSDYLRAIHGDKSDSPHAIRLYANINRSLLPNDYGSVSRKAAAFAKAAQHTVTTGYSTIKCAPFDECKAPFSEPGFPKEAMLGIERIEAVRSAVPYTMEVYVDCHSRFDLSSSMELEPLLVQAGAAWMEEPVNPTSYSDDLRIIRRSATLPISGGENIYGAKEFQKLVDEEILDIVMPDVKFCGGPVEAYRIGVDLESRKKGTVSMHCPSGPISLVASAHVTAAIGGALPLEHAINEAKWRHETIEPEEDIRDGSIFLSGMPGIGCRINPVAIEARGTRWEP